MLKQEYTAAISNPPDAAVPATWSGWTTGMLPLNTRLGSLLSFLAILVQCAALYWVIHRFRIENGLFRMLVAAGFLGFIVNHLLPLRFRLRFFLLFSAGLIVVCLGLDHAQWSPWDSFYRGGAVLAIGVALIAICRLPIRFGYRVAILLAGAAALGVFRSGMASSEVLDSIWPVLGAMFMYRTACYLYDVEHERTRSTWIHALSYFFLFPVLWLFVFPLIDFKTFVKEHYTGTPSLIYQRGVHWMMRGLIQLLIWRLLYYQVYVDPSRITNGTELAQYVLANVGLYLRVTGQFHFAIGFLHLFGFSLPETNRKFFLASDFVDYWRRANIYMKDFLMKLCYYPLVLRFKRLGDRGSVVAAVMGTFTVTWFMHPYQTFWISGSFPLASKDALFWALLCAGVIYSSLQGLKSSTPKRTSSALNQSIRIALSTGLTFTVITVLWSIWSADDLSQWLQIWRFSDSWTFLIGSASVLLVMAARLLFDSPISPWRAQSKQPASLKGKTLSLRWAAASCLLPAACLIGASSDFVFSRLDEKQKVFAQSFFSNTPNKSGEQFLTRGYYENIMDVARVSPLLDGAVARQPANWRLLESTPAVRETVNLRTRELVPSQNLVVNHVPFSSNSLGMRDREYAARKAPGAVRVALMGSSIVMGWNVPKEETFEAMVEEELNRPPAAQQFELLNFAVNGYSIVSLVEQLEQQVLPLQPDAVAVVTHPEDPWRAVYMLAKSLSMGYQPKHDFLLQLVTRAGITPNTPRKQIEQKLAPLGVELTRWAYQEMATLCRTRNVQPWLIYLPGVLQTSIGDADRALLEMGKQAGFQIMPLLDVYSSVEDRSTLMVAPWDAHPNARGHRLVGDALRPQMLRHVQMLRSNLAAQAAK